MTTDPTDGADRDRWLLAVLQRLLALEPGDLSAAMTEAAQQVAEVLGADKVDVFLYAPAEQALVAEGTSETPMGRREHDLGLDRLPLAQGGRTVEVFQTGRSHRSDHADQDLEEVSGLAKDLGVRSSLAVALEVAGERRGVLLVSSATPAGFTQGHLEFLEAVAHWLGLTITRLAQAEMLAAQAAAHGLRIGAEEPALTARQRDVAGLVRQGLTNMEIAERLVLEPGTVANHVADILGRLGFRSRSQIAVWAAEHGLGPQLPETHQR
jgi:two-component system, OmpR family, sensor kinase